MKKIIFSVLIFFTALIVIWDKGINESLKNNQVTILKPLMH